MLPGSLVERKRPCGKPTCHCADGKHLHPQFLLSVLLEGKPRTFHVPDSLALEVREKVEMRKRFEAIAAAICGVNLRRFFRQKEKA